MLASRDYKNNFFFGTRQKIFQYAGGTLYLHKIGFEIIEKETLKK
jgi:hypothetical protein